MKKLCQQTQSYKTPAEALALIEGKEFRTVTVPGMVNFCVEHKMVPSKPDVAFDGEGAVNFSTKYIKKVAK
jgi:hypothetical protein